MRNFDTVEGSSSIDKVQRVDGHIDGAALMMEGYKSRLYEKSSSNLIFRSLPEMELEDTKFAADSKLAILSFYNLDDRDRKTAINAEKAVQDRMTPEERRQLHKDKMEYDQELESFKRRGEAGALPFGQYKPPEKPASLRRYEDALIQEISKRDPRFYNRNLMHQGTYIRY